MNRDRWGELITIRGGKTKKPVIKAVTIDAKDS